MKSFYAIFLALTLLGACTPPETIIILVRHAEKANDGTDNPPLNRKGEERAIELTELLESTELAAIYSTPYRRNLQTVQPLAEDRRLEVTQYQPFEEGFLENIIATHAGEKVLVCGHSNTVPRMINQLIGYERYQNLSEDDYDQYYIVTVKELGEGRVEEIGY